MARKQKKEEGEAPKEPKPAKKQDILYAMRLKIAECIKEVKNDMQTEGVNVYRNSLEIVLRGLEQAHGYLGVCIETIGGELPKGYREEMSK